MVSRGERVHEALVRGHEAGTQALSQREIHQVVDRPIKRNGEPYGVCAKRLVGVPPNRHVLNGGDKLRASATLNLAEAYLSPNRIGYFGSEEARDMEFLPILEEIACVSRVLLNDKPFDRDARVDHQSHCRSVSVIAVFADQLLGGSLGAPL